MAGTTVGEFVLNLVVDAGKGELTIGNLVSQMGQLEVASVGEIAVLVQLAQTLTQITEATLKTSLGLTLIGMRTGASTQELEKWESAARHTVVGAEPLADAFSSISEQIYKMTQLGQQVPIMNLIGKLPTLSLSGLDFNKPLDLLKRIGDDPTFKRMTSAERFNVLEMAGLGKLLEIESMRADKKALFNKYSEEAGTMSEKEKKKYADINNELATMENISLRIKRILSEFVSDRMLSFFKGINTLLSNTITALKAVERFEHPTAGTTVKERIGALGTGLSPISKDLFSRMLEAQMSSNPASIIYKYGIEPLLPTSAAVGAGSKTEVHAPINVNINGTKMSPAELSKAVYEGIMKFIQPTVAQTNIGVTA